ncbi:O-antigen polymerase [Chryseomicrobium palamuruense]|uniref:O-antigen polymerase n=1 Tax=Chryseomicrobium palamuruense TaxID=682973 RepID=A0ABV8USE2_9BACL
MIILLILVFCLFYLFVYFLIKNRPNRFPLTFYVVWWLFWLIISSFNPYNLYNVSFQTYLLLLVNIFMFTIGYFLVISKKKKLNQPKIFSFDINNKWIFILQLPLLSILFYYFIKYNMLLNSLNIIEARNIKYQIGFLFSTPLEYMFNIIIIEPLMSITMLLFSIKLFRKKSKDFTTLLMAFNIFLSSQIGLGRLVFFELMVYLFVTYIVFKSMSIKENAQKLKGKTYLKEQSHKGKLKAVTLIILIFVLVTGMAYITMLRRGISVFTIDTLMEGYSLLFRQTIVYFVGPFRSLDYLINSDIINIYGLFWGKLTFGGIENLVGYIFLFLDPNYKIANYVIGPLTQNPITIGNGVEFNAFYTSLMNYYLDFNIIGVLIIPLIYGMINAYITNLFLRKTNIVTLMLFIFITYQSIASSFRWNFQFPGSWIVILILVILGIIIKKNNYLKEK